MNFAEVALVPYLSLDFLVGELMVAFEDDLFYFHLRLFVHLHIEHHQVFSRHVITLYNVDDSVFVAFPVKVLLSQNLRAVNEVLGEAHTLSHAYSRLQVLALALLHTIIVNRANLRSHGKVYGHVHLVIDDAVGCDTHMRKQSVLPVAFHRLGDFSTRDIDFLPHRQSRQSDDHIVLITFNALNGQSSYLNVSWRAAIGDFHLG